MQFDPDKITFFGRTDARGSNVAFGIKAKDRQRHVYVIGKTGMGKSTLLENMAVQDIQNGEGMAFIDPHGSAAETLLNYIPEHRIKDVLYFSPADMSHPISFNIMEDVGADKRHLVVSGLMSVFKKIWVDAWSARMEYILSNTLLALLEYPGSTLLSVNRMLADKKYRDLVVANVTDPAVKSFWVDEFAKYTDRFAAEATPAIQNKIGQFTSNPIIRNIIGQPKSSFDIRKMMDEKKILIMNLSKGLIGETNANLLGSMLTTRIYLAAMSRADLSPEKMREAPNFYFYVDEFQSFANATFANILSEARKYHLNLTIAHQYIEQMEEEVRDAVFGNVGTIIAFRVGPFDAEVLETIFTPQFLATDIVNLGFAQVYLTLMIDGMGSQPFSATTLPPIAPQIVSYKDMVISASRQAFSRLRPDVERDIEKFHEPIVVERVERPRVEPERKAVLVEERRSGQERRGSESFQPSRPRDEGERRSAPVREEERRNGNGNHSERRELERPPRPREEGNRNTPVREEERQNGNGNHTERREPERPPRPRDESERQRSEFQRERPKVQSHEPLPQKKNPTEHLNDLRSLLKKVVTEESVRATEKHSVKAVPKQEVQQLKKIVETVIERSEVVQEIPKPAQEEPKTQAVPKQIESVPSNDTNRISPKELERMMRITTNDKPPF